MSNPLKVKYWFNLIMFLFLLCTAATGLINAFIQLQKAPIFLGMAPKSWLILHGLLGVSTVVLILIHLAMHFEWLSFANKKIWGKNPPKE
ncbi:MAG: hypothetical protein HZB76_07160 [Chlamydiae bacterium]|nr:hypothetical protein [Chlamydiota bacterium]